MNIVYTVSNKFVPQLATSICSICENNKKIKEINFYVISVGIIKENKDKLHRLIKNYNRKLKIIEIQSIEKYFDFEIDIKGWSPVVLSRFLVGELLPKDVSRVIYLDADTIINGNLEELWKFNLKDKTIGASVEPTINKKIKERLDLVDKPYYNTGVLVIDLKKWRNRDFLNKIFNYYDKNKDKIFVIGQDDLNGAVPEEIIAVSPKYNFCNIYTTYPYSFLDKLMKPVKWVSKGVFRDAVLRPVIIHYLGEERPWRNGNKHKYRKEYEKYLSKTEWKDTPKENGWRLYFICWNIFNFIMKPFPNIRYKIITYSIPYFIAYRARTNMHK